MIPVTDSLPFLIDQLDAPSLRVILREVAAEHRAAVVAAIALEVATRPSSRPSWPILFAVDTCAVAVPDGQVHVSIEDLEGDPLAEVYLSCDRARGLSQALLNAVATVRYRQTSPGFSRASIPKAGA